MNEAIEIGNIDSVKFLFSQGIIPDEDSFTFSLDNLKMMKYLHSINCRANEDIIHNLIENQLESMEGTIIDMERKLLNLIKLGYRKDDEAIDMLFNEEENEDEIIWLVDNDFHSNENHVKNAIMYDYNKLLEKFVKKGYKLKSSDLDYAKEYDSIKCIKYLTSKKLN